MVGCPFCRETGIDPGTGEPCPLCLGHGVLVSAGQTCSACAGHGVRYNRTCTSCEGTGRNLATVKPFTEPPLRVPVEALKDALLAVRTGYELVVDGHDEVFRAAPGEDRYESLLRTATCLWYGSAVGEGLATHAK